MPNACTNIETVYQNNHAMSLIEVMIAMVIFAIGILAVGSMQISATTTNGSSRLRTEATVLAAGLVEQLMAMPYDTFGLTGPYSQDNPLADTDATVGVPTIYGWYNDPGEIYNVQWSVDDNNPATDIKTIKVQVTWLKKGKTGDVTLDFIKADL